MHGNSDIVNAVDFLHNSPRRHHLAQATIVSIASMLSGLFSPRQEITRPGEKVVRSSEGTLAQARKPLE